MKLYFHIFKDCLGSVHRALRQISGLALAYGCMRALFK